MDTVKQRETSHFSYIGIQYDVVTWSCFKRQLRFTQRDRVDLARDQFIRASRESNVADIAHCFMPDHVHQLVKGTTADADAKLYMRKAKQYSGFYFKKAFDLKLWGGKGFDRLVRDTYQYKAAVKYIIENPVKAGLVTHVEDYPYTGSSIDTLKELTAIAYSEPNQPPM